MFRILSSSVALLGVAAGAAYAAVPGEVDSGFGSMDNGHELVAFPPDYASAYASGFGPDGSIYLAGPVLITDDKSEFGVTRLTADGRFDPAYGTVRFAISGYPMSYPMDLVVQPDGKLITVGVVGIVGAPRWAVCRLLPNGVLDEGFGDVQTPGCVTPLQGGASAVALQADGRIVVAGSDELGDPVRAALIRLTAEGKLDTSFGGENTIALLPDELSSRSTFNNLAVSPDGGIVVVGDYGPIGNFQFMAARFTADGVLRPEFSQDGVRLVDYTLLPPGDRLNFASGLALLPDDSMLVSGTVYVPEEGGSTPRVGLVKLEPDGDLSPDFTSPDFPDGQLLLDPCVQENCSIGAGGMAVLPDGRILFSGSAIFGEWSIPTLYSMRLTPSGEFDATYVTNNFGEFAPGVSLMGWNNFDPDGMLLQGGRMVIHGQFTNAQDKLEFAAMRVHGDSVFGDGLESD